MNPRGKLAIVHVVDSLDFGGLERVVTDLAIEQMEHGHRACVFSINETAGFRTELERAGVAVVSGGKSGSLDTRVLRLLRSTARRMGADIVHSHNFVPSYYAALATLGLRRVSLVNTCHNMGSRLSAARLRTLYRLSLVRTRRVAMVSQQVSDRLLDMGIAPSSRTEVVLNGIPVSRHAPSPGGGLSARSKLGLAADALVVGCVGRLVPLKNHRLLLEQVPGLQQAFPRLHIVLIGEGPLGQELHSLADALGIADRVFLAGARSDVDAMLPAFDVFALPSLTEGLSIALLEACAAGRAIVASNVGGNPEVIADGVNGRLVAAADGAGLQATLGELLGDATLRARLGAAARRWVEENGSIEVMRKKYDAFYARAMGVP